MTLIQCCDLSLGYEGKCVLSHLELSVQKGDYLAIVGENGAGKSTLLKGILGLIRPTGGHIHFHLPPKEIGYLPQQTPIQRDFPASVMEVVLSGQGLRPLLHPRRPRNSPCQIAPAGGGGPGEPLLPGAFRRAAATGAAGTGPVRRRPPAAYG